MTSSFQLEKKQLKKSLKLRRSTYLSFDLFLVTC